MEKVSVIIPIHNLQRRGYIRVFNSIYSLLDQDNLQDIIIVDSSDDKGYFELLDLITNLPLDKVIHLRIKSSQFNKPLLLNAGIKRANSKWILCTDADYLFKDDFLDVCKVRRNENSILFKEVKMLPRITVTKQSIKQWKFPISEFNEWGKLANGACQYATKEFFINNPYPEQMTGFGAMDNIMAYIAYNKGLDIIWVEESEILHQYHQVEKFRTINDNKQFKRNQEYLSNYIKEYNLPKLLTK